MGCLVFVWLLFFQWSPMWTDGLVFFSAAYLMEIAIRSLLFRCNCKEKKGEE